jgi:hypothetical protein
MINFTPDRFSAEEGGKGSVTHWIGGSVGASAGRVHSKKSALPLPGFKQQFLGCRPRSLVTTPTELSRLNFLI